MSRQRIAWALAAYSVLAVVLTWPVAAHLATRVPFYNDTWIFVWDVASVRQALLDPARVVFATRDVFHPEGISLAFHTLAPLYGALAVPIEPALGLIATYNLFFLTSFLLSAIAAFALAFRLTRSPFGSFLAGALYAFSPFHLAHAYHLNLLTLEFLPVAAWATLALLATARRRHAVLLAASAALLFYACLEYALFAVLFVIVAGGHGLLTRGRGSVALAPPGDVVLRLLLAAAITLALVLPGLVPMLAEAAVERHYFDPVDVTFSADVFSWITPSVLHSLWGGYTMKVYQHFPGVLAEWTTFVGVTVAALGLAAIRARRERPVGVWLTTLVVFGLLAMGPTLRLLGQPLPVPLPYRLLKLVPVLSAMREPSRFAAMVTLATSVLAASGYAALRSSPRIGRLAWAAFPLALLEFVQVPLATSAAAYPRFLDTIAADGEDYAVLDVPSGLEIREHLYHQARHHKRILLGYIARLPQANRTFIETLPLLADPATWDLERARPGETAPGERYVRLARELGVRYALVHEEFYRRRKQPERFAAALANLERLPGAHTVAREPGFAAVRIDGR